MFFLLLLFNLAGIPLLIIFNLIQMATQQELAEQLTALTAQVEKSRAEVVAKVTALEEALANAGGTTPEVDAALTNLKAAVQSVDDLNPDEV